MRTILSETVEDLKTFEKARSANIERVEYNISKKEREVAEMNSAINNEISSNAALRDHIETQRDLVQKNQTQDSELSSTIRSIN